ncbi:uncharacterized protein LOC114518730 [Dendronephthya gigantea]|uniref:uncharacterized protein LOC114518730 n=1 Tax=Dendronephthya gigantea TaxID=151771 RepID=UPI00106D8775|nr:uncharacterized protein LOC114518730 [Dendronephthya gigantea]
MCSRKRPSCLRSPSKDQLQSFSFQKLNNEMENRALFLKAILHAACVNNRNANRPDEWMPTIGMAAAVLLRNRSSRLNAIQLLLSILLYHSSWTYTMARFKVLRLVVSHVHLYHKLDEFGKNYDASVKAILAKDMHWLASNANVVTNEDSISDNILDTASDSSDSSDSDSETESQHGDTDDPENPPDKPDPTVQLHVTKLQPSPPSPGQKITIDNIDYRKEVHYMTTGQRMSII